MVGCILVVFLLVGVATIILLSRKRPELSTGRLFVSLFLAALVWFLTTMAGMARGEDSPLYLVGHGLGVAAAALKWDLLVPIAEVIQCILLTAAFYWILTRIDSRGDGKRDTTGNGAA
jgi:hypothetical protein